MSLAKTDLLDVRSPARPLPTGGRALYEADELLWREQQVAALRAGRLGDLDAESLVECLESMSAGERRELRNRLAVLLAHVLKVLHQPGRHTKSWNDTIDDQQSQLALLFETTPSLRRLLAEHYSKAYAEARRLAARETGLPIATFPAEPPMAAEAALAYAPPAPPPPRGSVPARD